jgi:uncharacterized protein YggE
MHNKFLSLVSLMLLAALLSACATAAFAQSATPTVGAANEEITSSSENPRTLSANGTGQVYLIPDIAYVTVGVHTVDKHEYQAV